MHLTTKLLHFTQCAFGEFIYQYGGLLRIAK